MEYRTSVIIDKGEMVDTKNDLLNQECLPFSLQMVVGLKKLKM